MSAPHAFALSTIAARLAATRGGPHAAGEGSLAMEPRVPIRAPTPGLLRSPRAAVAAILREGRDGADVLLIRRAERAGDPWSGHMAFPGGRRDEGDRDLYATVARETREEVGIDLDADGVLLGRLPDLDAVARARRTGLVITPFVFALERETPLVFDPTEVAEALWAPLGALARGEGAGTVPYAVGGGSVELPCWHVEGHVVWGLTYRMLQTLFEAVRG